MKKSRFELGHHWVMPILEKLGQLAPLPSKGILAGQAVASALMDLLGLGGGVYNDIDIFVPASKEQDELLTSQAHQAEEAMRLGLPTACLDEYRMLSLGEGFNLHILGATQDGLINYVWCKTDRSAFNSSRVVYSFDLNAVEVAIDLEHLELTWSREFEYFLNTRELEITSLVTPVRTLLRYFKKRKELPVFGQDTVACDLVASWLEYYETPENYGLLSHKLKGLVQRFADELAPVFCFDAAEDRLRLADTWLYPEGMEDLLAIATSDFTDADGLTRAIPKMVYGRQLQRATEAAQWVTQGLAPYELPSEQQSDGFIDVLHMSLVLFDFDYLADQRSPTHYRRVAQTLKKHPDLCAALFGLSLEEQYQCILDLAQRAKEHGDDIYGMVESGAVPLDMWNQHHRDLFFRRFERDEKGTVLAEPLFECWEAQGSCIRELLTKHELRVEGQHLGHCVGGYGQAISTGRSRILSIRCGPDRSQWTTAEIAADTLVLGKKVVIRQHYGHRNSKAPQENRELLMRYLEREAAHLGFQVACAQPAPCDFDYDY